MSTQPLQPGPSFKEIPIGSPFALAELDAPAGVGCVSGLLTSYWKWEFKLVVPELWSLRSPCGWPEGPYGGMGVVKASAMCADFPNSGTKISNASTAAWVTTEIKSERRRTWRSRLRCSASPSTRHERSEPRLSFKFLWETLPSPSGITHLQRFFCERGSLQPR